MPFHKLARTPNSVQVKTSVPVVLGIDPGTKKSGWAIWDGKRILDSGVAQNEALVSELLEGAIIHGFDVVAIEMPKGMNAVAGNSVFETCRWVGRFEQAWLWRMPVERLVYLISRPKIKAHLLGTASGSDADVNAAVKARFYEPASGKFTSHAIQAGAVAIAVYDRIRCGIGEGE